ncbi:hypothetical protein [Saccharopolyspora spinosa]|uniref:hypothetical protein n=1 Tax=Saccharopolyspora spinosa TaxID=60894 RepID=UPI0002379518|nr:hypothetical protein [Saccharopolyspora spinosa]
MSSNGPGSLVRWSPPTARRSPVDADGTPTGELHETSAVMLGSAAMPSLELDELARRVADLHRAQNAVGITGAHMLGPGVLAGHRQGLRTARRAR